MILIYGATGFLGTSLMKHFAQEHYVIGTSKHNVYDSNGSFNLKLDQVLSTLEHKQMDNTFIYCASMRYDLDIYRNKPVDVYIQNMEAFFGFIKLLRNSPPKKAILTSSFAVYGAGSNLHDEQQMLHPSSFSKGEYFYSSAKLNQEQIFIETCERLDIDYSVVRVPGLYGPNATLNLKNAHVIPSFIMKAIQKKSGEIQAFGTGEEKREFLYVPDLVKVYASLTQSAVGILNVTNSNFVKIRDLAKLVEDNFDNEITFIFSGDGVSDVNIREVSNNKFQKSFKDFQFTPFKFGLRNTIRWYINELKSD